MKRSSFTTLCLGTALTVPFLLGGCEKQQEAGIYKDVASCTADGYSQKECEKALADAEKQHVSLAPKYDTKKNCEDDFGSGQCQQTAQQGHASFFPYYYWYMMGRNGVVTQPVYRTADGYFRSSGGTDLGYSAGRTSVSESAAKARPSVSTTTVERGGFGAFGRARAGGGFGS